MLHINKGNCQICGSLQAVDNKTGRLAKHGYTVKDGYFSGSCAGSHQVPFQISHDFLDLVIERTKKEVADLLSYAAEVETKTENSVYLKMPSAFRWAQHPDVKTELNWVNAHLWTKQFNTTNLENAVKTAHKRHAYRLTTRASQGQAWIDFQVERLVNWTVKPLIKAVHLEQEMEAAKAARLAAKTEAKAKAEADKAERQAKYEASLIWTEEKVGAARRKAEKLLKSYEKIVIYSTKEWGDGPISSMTEVEEFLTKYPNTGKIKVEPITATLKG